MSADPTSDQAGPGGGSGQPVRVPPVLGGPSPFSPGPVPPVLAPGGVVRPPGAPPLGQRLERQRHRGGIWGTVAVLGLLLLKLGGKLKFLLPVVKWVPAFLKTGGTMLLSMGAYALAWPWQFAVGFVLLILVHELGHLVAARHFGLKVGAPVFIPFMGAFIALKEAPRNAWVEAVVGIGGPLFGTMGAGVCLLLHAATGQPFWSAIAYTGFWLNLFNLAPVGFLDGGRIVTALSPWLWIAGYVILGGYVAWEVMAGHGPGFMVILVLLLGLPRLFSLFRRRDPESQRYFEVPSEKRWTMGVAYFGLVALLAAGMRLSHVTP